MRELQSALAVGLEVMLQGMHIFTLDDLAAALRGRGDAVAAYISSDSCRRAAFAAIQAHERQARTMATVGGTAASIEAGSAARLEIQLLCTELAAAESAAAQLFERSALATKCALSSMVEVDVAESMVAEALQIGDEQAQRATPELLTSELTQPRSAPEQPRSAPERPRSTPEQPMNAHGRQSCLHASSNRVSTSKLCCWKVPKNAVHAAKGPGPAQLRRCWRVQRLHGSRPSSARRCQISARLQQRRS